MSGSEYAVTYEQAIAMLPGTERIHTFVNPVTDILAGADWDREDVLTLLREGSPELSGEHATAMHHGLIAWRGDGGGRHPVFIETKPEGEPGR